MKRFSKKLSFNCDLAACDAGNYLFCDAGAMSALGQKRTYALHQPMSALPPTATAKTDPRNGHVCFTLQSRHVRCNGAGPLRANSGHRASPVKVTFWKSHLVGIPIQQGH